MEAAAAAAAAEEQEAYDLATSAVDQMPPGFRFNPTDWEIIIHYLLKKAINTKFRAVPIGDIDLNKCEPWDLPQKARKNIGENEWFFFFEKETKYRLGTRTNRATTSGYWKATGKDKEIHKGKMGIVGMKKTLVFYNGRAPKGEKTNWVIHEYRLHGDFSAYNLSPHAKERWVVCRVFHRNNTIQAPGRPSTELSRIDSFVDRYLVDVTPSPLPLLIHHHPSSSSHTRNPSSSSDPTQETHQIPSTLILRDELQHHQINYPHLEINTYNQSQYYSSAPHDLYPEPDFYSTEMADIDSLLPYEWYLTNFPSIKGGDDDNPNSRILAPDHVYIGGKEPHEIRMSTDMIHYKKESEGKISAAAEEEKEEGVFFSPNNSELDSIWRY